MAWVQAGLKAISIPRPCVVLGFILHRTRSMSRSRSLHILWPWVSNRLSFWWKRCKKSLYLSNNPLELQSVWTLRLPLFCSLSELQRAAYGPTSKLSWQASHVPVSTLPPKALRCPSQSSLSGVSPGQKEHTFGIWKAGASLQESSQFFFKGPDSTFLEAFDKAEENTF